LVVKGDPAEKLLQTLRDLLPGNGNQVARKTAGKVPSDRTEGREPRTAAARRGMRRRA